jgi:hypothetical protein
MNEARGCATGAGERPISRRKVCAVLTLVLAGTTRCGRKNESKELLPPVVGGWQRSTIRDVPVSEAPALVSRAGLRRIQSAEYEGNGKIEVQVYDMTSSGLGVDLSQRWHPAADTVFFYRDNYFAVVKWQQADRTALQSFLRDLEKQLEN